MKAIFCKDLNAHYNNAILNVVINLELNSADLHLTNGGGGRKSRLCATHYPLNPKLSLYTLLFTFYFFVIASECITQAWQAIKSKMLCQIDCHAKNRLRSFLLAMTGKTANALPCHTETLCRSIHRKITLLNSIYGYFAIAQYDSKRVIASRFCENGVAIRKFSVIFAFWIATLALLARNDGKAKIQIFHSKFKAFHKFNSFYKIISNFKPYTRLFHIFTPSFRSVQTDKKFFTRRTLCLNRNF